MKILAFSDLHQDVEMAKAIVTASDGADVLVGAGDFGVHGTGTSITLDILQTANIPTVLVSGNHDKAEAMQQLCLAWEHVHFLHGESVTINGVAFFELGAETPPRETASWSESLSEESAKSLLKNCPDHGILITHTPPLGFADLQNDGTHEGSQAILTAIRKKNPILNLCGHIHHSWGASSKSGDTWVHNLGPTMNWFDINQFHHIASFRTIPLCG